ncbi:DNA (cytosine-5-)-methyltransferase [Mycoplasma todarodis]|uniref:Cytosine-specific methyltransferase n=1 Tax=Mycoplasma todarodis TaxID=1937191 RepID=A0A4R0XR57_9MOLU|nr:DNA (cytosine-5-)-methyltransferase [Mycoplasma todarodis]TCG12090.1 hypothetical protein C4B25_00145 [Mycoplasma todarodis]
MKNNNKLKVIELFSGIGAQHKALDIIKKTYGNDFEIVGTSEWAIKSILAYNKIHHKGMNKFTKKTKEELLKIIKERKMVFSNDGQTPVTERSLYSKSQEFLSELLWANENTKNMGSILDIEPEEIINREANLITYSFPCQDISTGAQFTKMKTGLKGQRSGLLYEVERLIKGINKINSNKLPKFLLLENVSQLVKNKEFKKGYDEWIGTLREMGYVTKTYQCNALDFGIPQSRKRVFALSVLGGAEFKEEKELIDLYFEKYNFRTKTLEQIIERKKYEVEQVMAMVKPTPSRESMRRKVPKLLETRFSHTNTLTKKHDRTPSPGTINVSEFENVLKLVEEYRPDFKGYNYYYRFLTARECLRIMGFDDKDWISIKKLGYGIRSYYEMAGNSIVVNNLLPIFDEVFRIWNK